jgi:hypothetical protein
MNPSSSVIEIHGDDVTVEASWPMMLGGLLVLVLLVLGVAALIKYLSE